MSRKKDKNNQKEKKQTGFRIIQRNRKALHDYHILETVEAGIELKGPEVKSIRDGKISLKEAYCFFKKNELFLKDCDITPYKNARGFSLPERTRDRKLLLHKWELKKWEKKINEKGYTIIPLKIYISVKGHCKLELGLAKGKKMFDKREDLKKKDAG